MCLSLKIGAALRNKSKKNVCSIWFYRYDLSCWGYLLLAHLSDNQKHFVPTVTATLELLNAAGAVFVSAVDKVNAHFLKWCWRNTIAISNKKLPYFLKQMQLWFMSNIRNYISLSNLQKVNYSCFYTSMLVCLQGNSNYSCTSKAFATSNMELHVIIICQSLPQIICCTSTKQHDNYHWMHYSYICILLLFQAAQ